MGALVGKSAGSISTSYAAGAVSSGNRVGGLVGVNYGSITASDAGVAADGSNGSIWVGGLVGMNEGAVTASYALDPVAGSGSGRSGGLAGRQHGSGAATDSYWDTETSGLAVSEGGTGKTTAELQSPTGYTGIYASWNLDLDNADDDDDATTGGDSPWQFGQASDYPYLPWQDGPVRYPVGVSLASVAYGAEGGFAEIAVTVSQGLGADLKVNWAATPGTASAEDYSPASGSVTFPAGPSVGSTQNISIALADDNTEETAETFTVSLAGASGLPVDMVNLTADVATVTIESTDIVAISVSGPENGAPANGVIGGEDAVFTVSLTGGVPPADVTVSYATADGTASEAEGDYTATSGTLTFPAGSTASQTVSVPTTLPAPSEFREEFGLTISNLVSDQPSRFKISTASASAMINRVAHITLNTSVLPEDAGKTTITGAITVEGEPHGGPGMVLHPTFDGTAALGGDADYFLPGRGHVILLLNGFSSGEITVVLQPNLDGVAEGNETIVIGVEHDTAAGIMPVRGYNITPAVIVLADVDDPSPVIAGAESVTLTVAENAASETSVGSAFTANDADGDDIYWSLQGDDAGLFAISANQWGTKSTQVSEGQLSVAGALNYEESATHSVTVVASDGGGEVDTVTVTINVTDVAEPPSAPTAPTVSAASSTSLSLSWTEPENTGPAITGYDVQYRQGTSGAWTNAGHSGAGTSVTITGLTGGTAYEVQVRASNDEGTSDWSPSATGSTDPATDQPPANRPPQFSQSSFKFNLRENRGRGWQTPQGKLTATDPDGADDAITYAITGGNPDCAGCVMRDNPYRGKLFRVAQNARITYQGSGEDYESFTPGAAGYALTLTATDGAGASGAVTVTVTVKDDDSEAPAAPAAPAVVQASATSLTVSWTEPANAGPDITGYDAQYRAAASANWIDAGHTGTSTSVIVTGLAENTEYQARVRASNDEGASSWSPISTGSTAPNAAPVIAGPESVTLDVMENAAGGTPVGAAFTATDADGDAIIWSLEGADAARFAINGGQISVAGALNYEESATHSVTVVASDGKHTRDTVAVTVNVTDDDTEAPSTPSALVVASDSSTGLTARWAEPDDAGPVITGYEVQYRAATSANWADAGHTGSSTDASITGLAADTAYLVQVRASNAGRTSRSSEPAGNRPPEFKRDSFEFALPENRGRGWQTPRDKITATDPEEAGAITYAIARGNPDCAGCGMSDSPYRDKLFRIAENSRTTYQGGGEDYEAFPPGAAGYPLAVIASDEHGATTGVTVTIAVKDLAEPPLHPPFLMLATPSRVSLAASWVEPDNTGRPAITGYDVQYRPAGRSPEANWKTLNLAGTALAARITGLQPGTQYEARVRANNAEGSSPWSDFAYGSTAANAAPVIAGEDTVALDCQ